MADESLRFDHLLPRINQDQLKPMTRLWGGGSTLRKDDCIRLIRQSLADPARVRAMIATLTPFETNALALLRGAGGMMDAAALVASLTACGILPVGKPGALRNDHIDYIDLMIRRGLILISGEYSPVSPYSYGGPQRVFSDERLLAAVGVPTVVPLPIAADQQRSAPRFRRPQTVGLDLIGFLQAIVQQGGVRINQNGTARVHDVRRLAKALGWSYDVTPVDGLPFPYLPLVLMQALAYAGLLAVRANMLVLDAPLDAFVSLAYADQVRLVLPGFIQAAGWDERAQTVGYVSGWKLEAARWALTVALAALRPLAHGAYGVDDFDQAFFNRIGEHFSLDYLHPRSNTHRKTPEQNAKEVSRWREDLRRSWLALERKWLDAALTTWVYYLGLVELSLDGTRPVAFRLTELGREVLQPGKGEARPKPDAKPQPAWIVQPTFEILLYLEQARPEQIAFLERHAERLETQQHVARYRLTRDSIYAALEGGATLDDLLQTLERSALQPVPQNVRTEIQAWSGLREQMTLYRYASILEFPDEAARNAAAGSLDGTPVGDRYLLIARPQAANRSTAARFDYAQAPGKCLRADETGLLKMTQPVRDLLLDPQIGRWAEPLDEGRWQLTQASVSAAIARGLDRAELFDLLQARFTQRVPALLHLALRAWTGAKLAAGLTGAIVLQCPQLEVFQAISASRTLRPFLRGVLAPDLLLVDPAQLDGLRQQLRWAGLDLTDDLVVGPWR